MRYRCINAFSFGDHVYPGGKEVGEGDPILATHAAHFAAVGEPPAATEVAVASEPRAVAKRSTRKASAEVSDDA